MNDKSKDMSAIVTFEQAKRLKKVGYGIMCSDIYTDTGELLKRGSAAVMYNRGEEWEAPTVSDSLQWIRDNHGIPNSVTMIISCAGDFYGYEGMFLSGFGLKNTKTFPTFPEAESALLDKILDYLESK